MSTTRPDRVKMAHFNFRQFLTDHYGHAENVVRLTRLYLNGHCPDQEAVRKWFVRGSVPSVWFALLCAVIEIENGRPVSTAKYLTTSG